MTTMEVAGLFKPQNASTNFNSVRSLKDQESFDKLLNIAMRSGLLSKDNAQINFNLLCNHKNPKVLLELLSMAENLDLLKGAAAKIYFKYLIQHKNPESLAYGLDLLNEQNCINHWTLRSLIVNSDVYFPIKNSVIYGYPFLKRNPHTII